MAKDKDWDDLGCEGISARDAADAAWKKFEEREQAGREQPESNHDEAPEANREGKPGSGHGKQSSNGPIQSESSEDDDERPPAYTDEALALRFAEKHAARLRYVAMWSKWYVWTGTYWRQDDTLSAFNDARKICRAASAKCNHRRVAKAIASAKTVAAVERLAKADRRLAAIIDQWDADIWLLNTPAGVVDLRTGVMRGHKPEDYITKITSVAPSASCSTPRWLSVLTTATGKDQDLTGYLQRLFGYALTGSVQEHSIHFAHGPGANSKTTILNVLIGILGNYHRTAPIETFTASKMDRHPTELAMLVGARLVTATETEEGRRWAESRIKTLTGGEKVPGRFMRQDFFEFMPQFTLIVVGNHKPGLRSVDEAIRRRFHLIPFAVIIPEKDRDPKLGDKLKGEWPGILHWCLQGCLAWQEDGLAPPKAVVAATKAYLESEDAFAAWLEEECELNPNSWERSSELFKRWREWAERSGESYGTAKQLRERLEARGFEPKKERVTRRAGYQGIELKPPETDTSGAYWNK